MEIMADTGSPLATVLLSLHSVVAARIHVDGRLIEANAGFLELMPPALQQQDGPSVASLLIQPTFFELRQLPVAEHEPAYEGLLTLGDRDAQPEGLKGRVFRHRDAMTVLAEYDIDELRNVYYSCIEQGKELAQTQRDLAAANRRIREMSLTDPLTGLANRRRLEERFEAEIERAKRHEQALSAVMCDIDHFKDFNDNYGHDKGDEVLVHFSELLKQHVRPADLVARYGGEEFVILMPHASASEAARGAERVRGQLEASKLDDVADTITASFGVAQWQRDEQPAATLERADESLYEAKDAGRNQVRIARGNVSSD